MTPRGKPTDGEGAEDDAELMRRGTPSQFVCPECSGAMREIEENGLLQFTCHVGHAYAAQTLLEAQSQDVEGAIWTALRALEDHAALRHKLAESARGHGHETTAVRYEQTAQDAERQVEVIRKLLLGE